MSALGGALTTDGERPRLPALLARLADGLARRGPDGCSFARRGDAGMVFRPFHTTPESPRQPQPLATEDGLLVAFDGRLDRRDELARRLGCDLAADAALVAHAVRRWGAEAPRHLVGDFALAAWDGRRGRLLLARDPFGSRPLFYTRTARGSLLWASNLASLRGVAGGDEALDEVWIAGYLAGSIVGDRSPYRALVALAPGHLATAAPGAAERVERFWPGEIEEVRLAGDGDYDRRFTALLGESVDGRLRATGPVFAELSGGLDSSSIVCLADRLLRRRGTPAGALQTISFVFDEATSSDEREHAAAVAEQTGRPAHRVSDRQALLLGERIAFECPSTLSTFLPRQRLLDRTMRRAGSRVLLSGIGGDDLLAGEVETPDHLAGLALRGRFGLLGRELAAWQRALGRPLGALLLHAVVLPLLATALAPLRRAAVRPLPGWAGARLARADRDRRAAVAADRDRHLPPAIAARVAALRASVAQQVAPRYVERELLAREVRYPFLHRPLVEFCLGLPWQQLVRSGDTRLLHRRALAGLLPPAVAERRDKRGPDEAMLRALDREWPWLRETFADEAAIYDHGFVEREPFFAALESARFGMADAAAAVFQAIELELWLRQANGVRGRSTAAAP